MTSLAKKLFVLFLGVALVSSTLLVYCTYFTQAKTIPKKSYSKKYLLKVQNSASEVLSVNSNNLIIYPVYTSDYSSGKGNTIKEMRIFSPRTKKSRIIPGLTEYPSTYGNYGVYIDQETSPDSLKIMNLSTGNTSTLVYGNDIYCAQVSKYYITYRVSSSDYGYGGGSDGIYVYKRKTKSIRKLIDETNFGSCPILSGKRVAWVSKSRNGIYLMDVTKTRPRRIAKIQPGIYNIDLNSAYVLYNNINYATSYSTSYKLNLYKISTRKTTTLRKMNINSTSTLSTSVLIGHRAFWRETKKIRDSASPYIRDPYRTTIYYYDAIQKKKYRLVTNTKYDYLLSTTAKGSMFIWTRIAKMNNDYYNAGPGYVYKITIK